MDLKKLTGKLMTVVAAGAMVMSIGGGVVWANNCKDEYAHMSFDESAGEYLDYTRGRDKQDTSCGYIKGVYSSNDYSFNATLVGSDGNDSHNYYEDFDLIDYDVEDEYEEDEEEGTITIYGDPKSYAAIQKHLEESGFEDVGGDFTYIPNDLKDVTPEQRETLDKMIERLEEFDDVQTVYTNMKPEGGEEE